MCSLTSLRARRRLWRNHRRVMGLGSCFAFLLCGLSPAANVPACDTLAEPTAVVQCALLASPELGQKEQEIRILLGERLRARSLLPAHPTLQVSFAGRRPLTAVTANESRTTFNWYVSLSQEIEIAGQRGARVRAADAALSAQEQRVFVTAQEIASAALLTYYELLAAREAAELGRELSGIAAQLANVGVARAQAALAAPVDAHAAQAESARLATLHFEAERKEEDLRIAMATQLGISQLKGISGSLDALPDAQIPEETMPTEDLIEQALRLRADVAVARLEQEVRAARVQVLRRERVPNLTLSFLAQRDGFDEQVFGGGFSLPLPLPAPLGPSRAGEIVAAQAQVMQAGLAIERVRRQVRAEVLHAQKREQSYAAQARMFSAELATQARADLAALSQALSARTISPRDALLLERSLVEFLLSRVEIRRSLALSRIERLRAAGQPLVPPSYRGQP